MDRLEQLVRDTLAEHADHAPTVLRKRRRSHRARWAAAAAAAAIVALAVGLAVAHSSGGSQSEQPARPPSWVPAGYKPISYHGIEVAVPSALPVAHWGWNCGPMTSSQVMAVDPEALSGCVAQLGSAPPPPAAGTYVELAPYGMSGLRANRAMATEHVTLDAAEARRGYGTLPPYRGVTGVLALPQQGVLVTVTAPTRTEVDAILGTVHVAPVNWLGCALHPPTTAGNSAAGELVPSGAIELVVCVYAGFPAGQTSVDWLIAANRVPLAQTRDVVSELDRLPSTRAGTANQALGEWVVARYPDGTTRRISVAIDSQSGLILADGQHAVRAAEDTAVWNLLYPGKGLTR